MPQSQNVGRTRRTTIEIKTKRCASCKEEKEVTFFYTHKKEGYQGRCKTCSSILTKKWYKENPEKVRNYWLKRYGITLEDYNNLSEAQDHLCAICLSKKSPLHVDHCHTTGKVRGLLCFSCNTLLGVAKDSPNILKSAITYLGEDDGD